MTPEEVTAVSRWQLSVFEKVVGSCIVALLGWMAWTVQTTSTRVAVIEAKLTAATADNYTITINQKSGADRYIISITDVAAGSFEVTFATTGGTTVEQPVFTFSVTKGAAT